MREIIDFAGLPVFTGATVRTIIVISTKEARNRDPVRYLAPVSQDEFGSIRSSDQLLNLVEQEAIWLAASSFTPQGWSLSGQEMAQVIERLRANSVTLQNHITGGKTYFGIKTGLNEAFVVDQATRDRLVAEDPRSAEILRPVLAGRDVRLRRARLRLVRSDAGGDQACWRVPSIRMANCDVLLSKRSGRVNHDYHATNRRCQRSHRRRV